MDDLYKGEMNGLLFAATVTSQHALSTANNLFRVSKLVRPTGEDAREMLRHASQLEDAAECYRKAAGKAFEVLLQAAE